MFRIIGRFRINDLAFSPIILVYLDVTIVIYLEDIFDSCLIYQMYDAIVI